MDPDRTLVKLAKRGNRAAFGKLVLRYREKILNLAYDFLGDYENARDVAQDVFVKSWRNIRDFEEKSKFSSWLYRIAINTCLDAQKKIKKKRELPVANQNLDGNESSIIQQDWTGSIDDELASALKQLSQNQRTAIILRYFHDKSVHDIAEVIDCSDATVRIHLHRAIQKLDALLNRGK
jgi:RNA polymerase sigma-70 factor (ECF subfamily)